AAPVFVEALDRCGAAQEPLGRNAGDVDYLAAEQHLAARLVEHRCDWVDVVAPGGAHTGANADRLRGREVDAPLLDLGAGARGFAGRGDRAHLDADLAAGPLHPFPVRHLRHDRLDPARVVPRAPVRLQA